MTAILVGAGLASFVLCLLAVPFVIRLSTRTGFLDHPGPRKVHTTPIPYGGGLAVAFGFLGVMFGAVLAAWLITRGSTFGLPDGVRYHARGAMSKFHEVAVLCGGALVMLLLGLVDDKRKLSPRFKLCVQVVVAAGFVVGGERLSLFWEGPAGDLCGAVVTVVWIVGITNAFNLLDHMDGMAAGVALIACLSFGLVAWVTQQWFIAAALAALAGGCAGFLWFNFPPAKIFLGDAGSLFIGFVLATLTVTFTFYERASGASPAAYAIPLAALAVPLYDTASVVLHRLRHRRPVFEGDRNHVAHRLTAMGMSPRRAALTVYAMTLLTGVSAVLLLRATRIEAAIILSQLVLTFVIIALLDRTGRQQPPASS